MKNELFVNIKQTFKNHTIIILYSFVLVLLLYGVFSFSEFKHFNKLLFLVIPLYVFYFTIFRYTKNYSFNLPLNQFFNQSRINSITFVLLGFTIFFILYHLYLLGGIPPIKAYYLNSVEGVAEVRRKITSDSPSIINYISSFLLKAIIPFFILLLYKNSEKKVWYYMFFLLGIIYAFSLMQKSYILFVLVPAFIHSLLHKKFLFAFKYVACIICFVFALSIIANPDIKNEIKTNEVKNENISEQETINSDHGIFRIYLGLIHRISLVPGEMVSEWFDVIPNKKPFLYGNGYRLWAKITGNTFTEYSTELYPVLRPHFAQQGLVGTVNTASFMYDYANFGRLGLVISAFMLSVFFVFIEILFKNDITLKLSLNLFPVFILSSTAITTLLFSGGWSLLMIMYFIYKKTLSTQLI